MQLDLAARIEAAPEGSRELSNEVLLVLGWEKGARLALKDDPPFFVGCYREGWRSPAGEFFMYGIQPSPTESVDDAIGLVGCDCWRLVYDTGWGGYQAVLDLSFRANAATPALALSAALVRALEQGR